MSIFDNSKPLHKPKLLKQPTITYKTYYLTFPQTHIWKDNYIKLINVDSPVTARMFVTDLYRYNWSNIYPEDEFDSSFYPGGQIREYDLKDY